MNHKAFRQLLKRYLDNSCTDEERHIVDQWYELLDNENVSPSKREISEVEDKIWNKIQLATINNDTVSPLKRRRAIWWRYAAAASVIGVVVLAGALWIQSKGSDSETSSLVNAKVTQGFLEEVNNSGTIKNV